MLDKDVLGCRGTALHAVQHHHVGPGLDREGHVVVGPRRPDLHEDRHLPLGNFPELADLDLQVIGTRPVGVAAGAALVDAFRQVAHAGHPLGDLLAEQHAAAAGLRPLPDNHLDGVGLAQIIRVHAVARGQ